MEVLFDSCWWNVTLMLKNLVSILDLCYFGSLTCKRLCTNKSFDVSFRNYSLYFAAYLSIIWCIVLCSVNVFSWVALLLQWLLWDALSTVLLFWFAELILSGLLTLYRRIEFTSLCCNNFLLMCFPFNWTFLQIWSY